MMFYLVQPYRDGPDRLHHATIVSSHATATEAFLALEQIAARLLAFGLMPNVIELFVVDEQRRLVKRGD
jgi:hypothetical protein